MKMRFKSPLVRVIVAKENQIEALSKANSVRGRSRIINPTNVNVRYNDSEYPLSRYTSPG